MFSDSFIDLNSYQYIHLICMHVFSWHLSMHARISWIFAYNVPKCLLKQHAKFAFLWFGMVFRGLDRKAISGERVCHIWIQLVRNGWDITKKFLEKLLLRRWYGRPLSFFYYQTFYSVKNSFKVWHKSLLCPF